MIPTASVATKTVLEVAMAPATGAAGSAISPFIIVIVVVVVVVVIEFLYAIRS